jgi:hypothetical protein
MLGCSDWHAWKSGLSRLEVLWSKLDRSGMLCTPKSVIVGADPGND